LTGAVATGLPYVLLTDWCRRAQLGEVIERRLAAGLNQDMEQVLQVAVAVFAALATDGLMVKWVGRKAWSMALSEGRGSWQPLLEALNLIGAFLAERFAKSAIQR
jgi:hypothetical protein